MPNLRPMHPDLDAQTHAYARQLQRLMDARLPDPTPEQAALRDRRIAEMTATFRQNRERAFARHAPEKSSSWPRGFEQTR